MVDVTPASVRSSAPTWAQLAGNLREALSTIEVTHPPMEGALSVLSRWRVKNAAEASILVLLLASTRLRRHMNRSIIKGRRLALEVEYIFWVINPEDTLPPTTEDPQLQRVEDSKKLLPLGLEGTEAVAIKLGELLHAWQAFHHS